MTEDFDDTRLVTPSLPAEPRADPDLDKTIIAGSLPPMPAAPSAPVVSAAPPAYYRFTVGGHPEIISLDAPCYIGRRPTLPRVAVAGVPRLLRVPSPLREVSATHLEIRQVGTSVIVTDLRSTNGSIVMVPGSTPRKLRQGESVVVSPGTLVDIGDSNILQILPLQRSA